MQWVKWKYFQEHYILLFNSKKYDKYSWKMFDSEIFSEEINKLRCNEYIIDVHINYYFYEYNEGNSI